MDKQSEQRQAAEALATIQAYQEKARRSARVPGWFYAATFVLAAAGAAANDFVSLNGAKLLAGVVMVVLVVVLVASFLSKTPLLSRVRGVQPRQTFNVWISVGAAVVGYVLVSVLGPSVTNGAADAIGLHNYPNTVAGVLYAALFTGLIALRHWKANR